VVAASETQSEQTHPIKRWSNTKSAAQSCGKTESTNELIGEIHTTRYLQSQYNRKAQRLDISPRTDQIDVCPQAPSRDGLSIDIYTATHSETINQHPQHNTDQNGLDSRCRYRPRAVNTPRRKQVTSDRCKVHTGGIGTSRKEVSAHNYAI
jgi:hypothetical protein